MAVPAVPRMLPIAVPMRVPATPKKEACAAAVTAARQPAISCTKLSSNLGGCI
jgi:hypothetical protein